MKFNLRRLLFLATILLYIGGGTELLNAQSYIYFQDSPDPNYYEYSWMELTAPSELERMQPPDLRKFPVESGITAQQGANSLRLKWTSKAGGDWVAIAAGLSWENHNLSDTDTLIFWVQSIEGIAKTDLPKVFMEDITNKKSVFLDISDWTDNLAAGVWTRIAVPMRLYLNSGDGLDYTKVKTIGFAQNGEDGVAHTLLVDNMRVNREDGNNPQVSAPTGVNVRAYEYHFEITWDPNPESYLNGYVLERSLDGGANFTTLVQLDEETTSHIDWVKPLGEIVNAHYRVKALNEANEPSGPSEALNGTTQAMSDDELLDMVQKYTFRYFWDFGHAASGMARERNRSGNTVTSGGSGFGIMTIPVGIERGLITREEGATRVLKMLNFLATADRFHGAWSHWINGNTGKVIPFSPNDNGGDIVETAFMAQGLLTIRQYFNGEGADEKEIVQKATELWEGIEWDWYRRNGTNSIYWHWSPDLDWIMNMTVSGWNEAAIVYLLAIASPTHGVPASLWKDGWAKNNNYENGKEFYGRMLFLGKDYGGPLFFAHYSFLGFDPRDKADDYANYFHQNKNHSIINHEYCAANPKGFKGYAVNNWGLTASDDPDGYMAHEPNSDRDNGTITPTAALSSFPYTPTRSMAALKHFYRSLGDKIWGEMGFYDAFNEQRNWYADSYLAIDQGPIIVMIENYRTQLCWNLFMANPEIQPMLDAIGFKYSPNAIDETKVENSLSLFPNPSSSGFNLKFSINKSSMVKLEIYSLSGSKVQTLIDGKSFNPGEHTVVIQENSLAPGMYIISFESADGTFSSKLIKQ